MRAQHKCQVHVGDTDCFAEYEPCGDLAVGLALRSTHMGGPEDWHVCQEHAEGHVHDTGEADSVEWYEGFAPSLEES